MTDTPEQVQLLHGWLNAPHVAERWDGPLTLAAVQESYFKDEGEKCERFLVYLDGQPLAYIQSYIACLCSDGWWEDITDPGTVGIDFFIGEAGKLNHGLGTALLQAFARKLFSNPSVNRIISDPSPENPRSIAALQKAGFTRLGDITTPDGAAVLLEMKRSETCSSALPV